MSEPVSTPAAEDEPVYTTAIIAAIPAADDPIHDHVAADAHITMVFLGQAADIPADAVEAIKDDLSTIGQHLAAFDVDISGTAILGEDQANVLLIESQTLTNLKNLLASTPEVQEALALSAGDQFPNWIPHLTLAYPEDDGMSLPVTNPPVDTVTIGALALWLGGDKSEYPLQPKPYVFTPDGEDEPVEVDLTLTAAAGEVKAKFDEALHPRGADGRFIEKFSVIKYLTGGSWSYGKVENIYKDNAGQVKVHVVPGDLLGKPNGKPAVDLVPGQVYHAPTAKAALTIDHPAAKKIGGQGGSNPGGLYEVPKPNPLGPGGASTETEKFYVKTPQTAAHGKNEALANALYEEAGVPVPSVSLGSDGKLYSKIVPGEQDMASHLNDQAWLDAIRRNYAVDAWLANRDVFGMGWDNVITGEDGVPYRIDNGGALLYRAQGAKKTDFTGKVTELDSFRQGKKSKVYGPGMTKDQELDGAQRVLAISPGQIDQMVSDAGLPKSLADTLKARRLYLADYYGLTPPEASAPDGAEGPTSAPLVDAADLATSKGKARSWFHGKLSQLPLILQSGDRIEFPDGSQETYGLNDDGSIKSVVSAQAQLLSWQQVYGLDAEIMYEKGTKNVWPRPAHESVLKGSDLSMQNFERGDKIVSSDQVEFKVLGANSTTGAVLVQAHGQPVRLLDSLGADGGTTWTVHRWDPPAEEPEPDLSSLLDQVIAQQKAAPSPIQTLGEPQDDHLTTVHMNPVQKAPSEKTGQAAVAEAKIKNDLNSPLPTGNGAPLPTKTAAQLGEKKMLIGDGTEAKPGDAVTSNKDGKTYTFVKPKGQYAVVTDPNGADPDKQLLKLASTMTQPGKAPAADPTAIEKPKTASGEVPELGMQALAKDGWAGEITLISPDGKFVFITDANGTRKRKSTGTVTITSKTDSSVDKPKGAPGPVKDYGAAPSTWKGEEKVSGWVDTSKNTIYAEEMVHVGYADGTDGLEPYTGQPLSSLQKNANGDVATYGGLNAYLGPVSSQQLAAAAKSEGHSNVYQVIYTGSVFYTDGQTGPSGGLLLWYSGKDGNPEAEAFELDPNSKQVVSIISNTETSQLPLTMPTGLALQAFDGDAWPGENGVPLYGEEAKTLAEWKGKINEGDQISLDGQNWLKVTQVLPSGGVEVETSSYNGPETYLNAWSSATYVIKTPEMKDGDAPGENPLAGTPDPAVKTFTEMNETPLKKVSELTFGDVIVDDQGKAHVVASIEFGGVHSVNIGVYDLPDPVAMEDYAEFPHLGNAFDGVVEMPMSTAIPLFAPGHTYFPSENKQVTVVTFPKLESDGTYSFVGMIDGNPNDLALMNSGFFSEKALPVNISASTSVEKLGVTQDKIDQALQHGATIQHIPAEEADHNWQMAQAGIDFGNAEHPIYFAATDNLYYRNGPTGLEKWDTGKVPSQWTTADFGTGGPVNGPAMTDQMEKVWDGVSTGETLHGKLNPNAPQLAFPDSADYVPKPGQVIQQLTWNDYPGGAKSFLVAYPDGSTNGHAYMIMDSKKLSTTPFGAKNNWAPGDPVSDDWKSAYNDTTTIHDPFAAGQTPSVTHHDGPMPQLLADNLAAKNYQPKAGVQYFVLTDSGADGMGAFVYEQQPDGSYRAVTVTGQLSPNEKSLQELTEQAQGAGFTTFTWTAPHPGGEPSGVQGLPDGYAPFVPGEGQSVVLYKGATGYQHVYVQSQPGASWYKLNEDGTVTADEKAAVSNFLIQGKLAGKGNNMASATLLHDGTVPGSGQIGPSTGTPSFNGYTPSEGEQVLKVGGPSDPDPWYYVNQGGVWFKVNNGEVDPWNTGTGQSYTDADVQKWLADPKQKQQHEIVWPVDTTDTGVPAGGGTFGGYVSKPTDAVKRDEDGDFWVQTEPGGDWTLVQDGELSPQHFLTDQHMQAAADEYSTVQSPAPAAEAPAAPEKAAEPTPTFNNYTPQDGDTVVKFSGPNGTQSFYVKQDDGKWHGISQQGTAAKSGVHDDVIQSYLTEGTMTQVFPVNKPGGVFEGYQTTADQPVVKLTGPAGAQTYVKTSPTEWQIVQGGQLDQTSKVSQSTIEWAVDNTDKTSVQVTELQGSVKGGPVAVDTPLTNEKYAGVTKESLLQAGQFTTEDGSQINPKAVHHLNLVTLQPGSSAYAYDDMAFVRTSAGEWFYATHGDVDYSYPAYSSDAQMEADLNAASMTGLTLKKIVIGAPSGPPKKSLASDNPTISDWVGKVPNPGTFTPIEQQSLAKGTWVYSTSPYAIEPNSGVFLQLGEDYPGTGNLSVSQAYVVKGGKVDPEPTGAQPGQTTWPFPWSDAATYYSSDISAPQAAKPSAAQELQQAAEVKSKPSYPGAQLPSQEDINAWGGDLTKDGHIPTTGMFVTGKGPMSGKIVSVSKDKTKATVLTSDGKKTQRLITALKTDKSANYVAYAAPAQTKDVPAGMPLAVDTVHDAVTKTVKDGKFRAILHGHPGVSHGEVVVTKATGPSGKAYSRVHLTLTSDQREQLTALLSGVGEKGDWVAKSKSSEAVAIGDKLPMRISSQENPDGTPRWKVDSNVKPPTHEVTAIEPQGAGILKVTLKDLNTGEEIVSRFHTGKSLNYYEWDPNKPKKVAPGSLSLNAAAKSMGWSFVTDGGISAAKGGATNAVLYNEPGSSVSKSALGQVDHSWKTLRNISDDGVVIEVIDPQGSNSHSTTGVVAISVPEGLDETHLNGAFSKLGIDYAPMTQDAAKNNVRGLLRTLLNLDTSDVDTAKGWSDDKLFSTAGQTLGIPDLGWHDVLVGVDESTGKVSYFWSDRARAAIAQKTQYNLIYRAASTGTAAQIVSTVKFGSANSHLKRVTGMVDGSSSTGGGASASSDNGNHAGHGSYSSAGKHLKLPTSNAQASYKGSNHSVGMMVYSRPEAVLGRIADFRLSQGDAFGKGQGNGANHLDYALKVSKVTDYFIGGGLPTESVGYIAVQSSSERMKAIQQLQGEGITEINGRPIEELIITLAQAQNIKPDDLPPVTIPANARPILDLPTSFDTTSESAA